MPARKTAPKTAATKKTAARKTAPKPAPAPAPSHSGFIDAALMERAIALRAEGKTMKQIGAELNVKATGYLAKKIRETYGADALATPAKPATTKEA
jgi:hypothetical protein